MFTITLKDIDEVLKPKVPLSRDQIKELLPRCYWDYLDVFNPNKASPLPPHRPGIDHEIPIEEGKELP